MSFEKKQTNIVNNNKEEKNDSSDEKWKNSHKFFNRIAFLKLNDEKKANIAKEVIEDTYGGKLYRLELILSCLVASLGLLTNSIPVVIGAMLIAPILEPIKSFSFAVTTGSRSIYLKAIKTLGISILVAVFVSYLVTLVVPFADVTKEILARTSPTIVDLLIALASWVVAVLSLGFKRLSESVAWVAMAVALMPPLCVMWIGLQFLNRDIMLGSTLLFLTNLVAIIVVGIIIFYMFWFFPTNKKGKNRSAMRTILVFLTITIISIPLWKWMQSIAQDYKFNAILNTTFDNFLDTVDPRIEPTEIEYKKSEDKTLRINATLNVPNTVKITDKHKAELTQLLALATQNSIELELNIIDISSIYIDVPQKPDKEDLLSNWMNKNINDLTWVILVDIKIAKQPKPVILVTLFNDGEIDKNGIFKQLEEQTKTLFGEESTLLIQRQKKWQEIIKDKKDKRSPEEKLIQEQFNLFFEKSELSNLVVSFGPENKFGMGFSQQGLRSGTGTVDLLESYFEETFSGTIAKYENINIDLNFLTPQNQYQTKKKLEDWKNLLEKTLQTEIDLNVKVEYFSVWEL